MAKINIINIDIDFPNISKFKNTTLHVDTENKLFYIEGTARGMNSKIYRFNYVSEKEALDMYNLLPGKKWINIDDKLCIQKTNFKRIRTATTHRSILYIDCQDGSTHVLEYYDCDLRNEVIEKLTKDLNS